MTRTDNSGRWTINRKETVEEDRKTGGKTVVKRCKVGG